MTTIGFLGLGTMGAPMARRLIDAGFDVRLWNRSPGIARELAESGAVAVESPSDALKCDVSLSMFGTDEACLSVLSPHNLGEAGGTLHASMASISPRVVREIGARSAGADVAFVAAPVLGRPPVAALGDLNILAGGSDRDLDTLQPIFDVLGKRTWRLSSDPEVAASAKIAVNYAIIHAIQSLAESITLLERAGVAPGKVAELLGETLFGGVAHRSYGAEIAEGSYEPTLFSLELGRKDLRLAEALAQQYDAHLPMAHVLGNLMDAALADESLAGRDWAVFAELTRRSTAPLPG